MGWGFKMQVGHKGAWLKRIGRGFRMEEGLQGAGGAYKGRGQMGDGRDFRMRMMLKGGRGFTIEAGHQGAGLKGAGFEGWRSRPLLGSPTYGVTDPTDPVPAPRLWGEPPAPQI